MTQDIYPCLWFKNKNAKAAAEFYCSVFPDAKIISENAIVVNWMIGSRIFMGLNDAIPAATFNESMSFVITCKDQAEIDHYWEKLTTDGGKESMCGWCTDKFGISWQVVPAVLGELMSDPKRAPKVVQAFLKMKKFEIEKLLSA